jgi:hypothetical protein
VIFSADSNTTLAVTSCGRFDLLKRTLASFDRYNTAPIRQVFITEDAGDEAVRDCLPPGWAAHTRFWINRPALGQLASIDAAYAEVKTPYIFHCEDDWAFYRPGFIEDSMRLLEHEPQALQVWLRSLHHDLAVHSPYISAGERRTLGPIAYYPVVSAKADWHGFSFNPGLRRLSDYALAAPYAAKGGEKRLSQFYAERQRHALILENDAVLHTGWGEHVTTGDETRKKRQRKQAEKLRLALAFFIGITLGYFLE